MNIVVELIANRRKKRGLWPFIVQVSYPFARIQTNSKIVWAVIIMTKNLKLKLIQSLNSNTKRTWKKPKDGTVRNWAQRRPFLPVKNREAAAGDTFNTLEEGAPSSTTRQQQDKHETKASNENVSSSTPRVFLSRSNRIVLTLWQDSTKQLPTQSIPSRMFNVLNVSAWLQKWGWDFYSQQSVLCRHFYHVGYANCRAVFMLPASER